ncbi:c-type cytochrome [Microvirga roseola]|uniref:c-type cytochrome n=1 Tax=Microvirga roseola TaxID=2883126 RepID=UPI001E2B835E|nr:cytochrome c [Microvirga roseola]
MRKVFGAIAVFLVLSALGVVAFLYSGMYPIGATTQHSGIIYRAVDTLVRQAVMESAKDISPPGNLEDPDLRRAGLILYRGWCLQCHGAPGVAPSPFATGMNPPPPPLVQTAREWQAKEVWWVIDNGIAMAGMPAFRFKLTDEEMWAITAFVASLPELSPAAYAAMVKEAEANPGFAARRGKGGGS